MTVVEAAFALPILFMFMMAIIDLGMWTLNDNQATNAARDGARTGVIDYLYADVPGSADHDAIVEKIESHLPSRQIRLQDIDVRCVDPSGTELPGKCVSARVDVDRIEVAVDWTWSLITPIADLIGVQEGRASGVATMAIIGVPVAGTPPVSTPTSGPPTTPPSTPPTTAATECAITNIQVTPDPVRSKDNGQLKSDIRIHYDINQVDRCNALAVHLVTPGGTVVSAICDDCELSDSHHDWDYSSVAKDWKPRGLATVRIFNEFIDVSATFNVTG
ncbi:TadE family protein [Actinospongicola halichondriae]|uniref:TadE family protein n=1 Tax=Actinospongicola halichondriae TaxID=3236844 RepID=UPI003D4BD0E4